MPAELRSSSHGQTLVLTLYNPDQSAALEPGMYAAGVEALNAAGDNPDIRSVVIVGEGDNFGAGGHLQALRSQRDRSRAEQSESSNALNLWIDTISTFPKPVLAAVEATAGGTVFSIALACDLIVAARDAFFVLSQGRAGLSPDGGACWHLAQALPRNLVLEIALLGERLPAERLYAVGLVNRLAAPGEALHDALALADTLNQRAPNVLEDTKALMAAASTATLASHLAAERELFVNSLQHRNAEIGISALLNREVPRFE